MRPLLCLVLLCTLFCMLAYAAEPGRTAADAVLREMGLRRASPWEESRVTLPEEDDSAWKAYLEMQREAGYEMTPFCAKTVTRLACEIENHPEGEGVRANFYMQDDGKILGGDIMSPALDGFMHALKMPK